MRHATGGEESGKSHQILPKWGQVPESQRVDGVVVRGESPTTPTKVMAAYGQAQSSSSCVNALNGARIAAGQKLNQRITSTLPRSIDAASFTRSQAEPLGYTTAGFMCVFGVRGKLFSDGPDIGGTRRTLTGAYIVGAVHVVMLSAIAASTAKKS